MGLFDGWSADFSSPDANGWQTAVTPGGADVKPDGTMDLAAKLRLGLTGTTDKNPGLASASGQLGSALGQAFAPKAPTQQQHTTADPGNPAAPGPTAGMDIGKQMAQGQSPFASMAAAPAGQKKPITPIFSSPFAAAPTGQS